MKLAVGIFGSVVNLVIPALIFLFLNDILFLSKKYNSHDKLSRKRHRKDLGKLILVSPIGFFVLSVVVFLVAEVIVGAFLVALGITEFSSEFSVLPALDVERGFFLQPEGITKSNDSMISSMLFAAAVAIPVLVFVIRSYCKIIGCSKGLGVFVYMAVLYMYVTGTLITLPINEVNPTMSGLISTGSFIAMLIIFYKFAAERIEFMRENEDSVLMRQINTLPIINFILLVILLGLEIMLSFNGYMDMIYYLIILAFTIILYVESQLSYNILFRHIEERNEIEELSKQSLATQEQVTLAFAEITEAKSGQTGQHVKRVSEYARIIAAGMGLAPLEVEYIRIASMMHDIGKLLISPEILEKIGKLTEEEFEVMKTHVVIGENLLHNAPGEIMALARLIAWQHHEKWNGKGYLGMKGEDIALGARITAIADVYDALTSSRSYKKAWSVEAAYDMIVSERGEHFDPHAVDVFVEHFEEIRAIQEKYADTPTGKK